MCESYYIRSQFLKDQEHFSDYSEIFNFSNISVWLTLSSDTFNSWKFLLDQRGEQQHDSFRKVKKETGSV